MKDCQKFVLSKRIRQIILEEVHSYLEPKFIIRPSGYKIIGHDSDNVTEKALE